MCDVNKINNQRINLLHDINTSNNKDIIKKLYEELTCASWWNDCKMTNDNEREKFLHELFLSYLNLIENGYVDNTEIIKQDDILIRRYHLIMICKNQLKVELGKIVFLDYEDS